MPDSWEKIERDLRNWLTLPGGDPIPYSVGEEIEGFADRLRALRERDEKRWEIVRQVEVGLRLQATVSHGGDLEMAESLQAAREGK